MVLDFQLLHLSPQRQDLWPGLTLKEVWHHWNHTFFHPNNPPVPSQTIASHNFTLLLELTWLQRGHKSSSNSIEAIIPLRVGRKICSMHSCFGNQKGVAIYVRPLPDLNPDRRFHDWLGSSLSQWGWGFMGVLRPSQTPRPPQIAFCSCWLAFLSAFALPRPSLGCGCCSLFFGNVGGGPWNKALIHTRCVHGSLTTS